MLDREKIGANREHGDQNERDNLYPDTAARKKPERRYRDQHRSDRMWGRSNQKTLLVQVSTGTSFGGAANQKLMDGGGTKCLRPRAGAEADRKPFSRHQLCRKSRAAGDEIGRAHV